MQRKRNSLVVYLINLGKLGYTYLPFDIARKSYVVLKNTSENFQFFTIKRAIFFSIRTCSQARTISRGLCTVKPVYNDHPRYPKIVAAVDRWSLFGGHLCYKRSNRDFKIVVVVGSWSLFGGGR